MDGESSRVLAIITLYLQVYTGISFPTLIRTERQAGGPRSMQPARRLNRLPQYLFADLEEKADRLEKKGVDLIDLGIADPDREPPSFLVEAVKTHLTDPGAHRYPTSRGDEGVRKAVAAWFKGRFDVELDPAREVVILIGGKGGLADIARAVVDGGDVVAAPDPGYPVYHGAAAVLNDALARPLPLRESFGFLPDLRLAEGAKLLYLNYPNNPTGVVAPDRFYRTAADFAESHAETLLVWDAAYTELAFDDYYPPSILNFTRKAVEVHSLSKMMNATGYRIGFAVGDADALDQLVRVKTQVDSGAPVFIQRAMADALMQYDGRVPPKEVATSRAEYGRRKRKLEEGLADVPGIEKVYPSPATFFVWAKVKDDLAFVDAALEKGVILTPGRGFGKSGEGYVRAAVTARLVRIEQALQRLRGEGPAAPSDVDTDEEDFRVEPGSDMDMDEEHAKREFVSLKEAYPTHPLSSLVDEDEEDDDEASNEEEATSEDDDNDSPDDPEQLESTILSDPEDRPASEIIPEEVETVDGVTSSDGDDDAEAEMQEGEAQGTQRTSPAEQPREASDKEDQQSSEDIMGALEAFDEALEDDDLFSDDDEEESEQKQ
ncbi:aminotransferase class I/II-fold pyridoxal phosphate-dependent enzyme [bacterium]|nr:aminotransferase class I/II-fold pyridoxal phosphate-dependent enzyme [bacterium]